MDDGQVLSDEAWAREPSPDALRLEVVYDADLGTIASVTRPDGRSFTAADPG